MSISQDVLSIACFSVGFTCTHLCSGANQNILNLFSRSHQDLFPHLPQAIHSADMVIVMDKGKLKWVGNPTNLSSSSYIAFSVLNELDTTLRIQGRDCQVIERTEAHKHFLDVKDDLEAPNGVTETVDDEMRKEGRVQLSVYK